MSFEQQLAFGKTAESKIALWLLKRGNLVLPVYELSENAGKGPQLFTPDSELIAPDMLCFAEKGILWIEAKHKTGFSWYRNGKPQPYFCTGIDLRHYEHYIKVEKQSRLPVWLLFYHSGGPAKDSPNNTPSGLFGNSLTYLKTHESHKSDKWGKHGMVYWSIYNLRKLATLEEMVVVEPEPAPF
jgi:hypothetical protein